MSAHEPRRPTPGIPLQAHVEELRRRGEAIARLQGGSTYYHEELGIFRAYAEEAGLHLPAPPEALNRPPDKEGNEHQVWFDVSDTHRGNLVLMPDGILAPIDLRVQRLSGSLLDTVIRLTK